MPKFDKSAARTIFISYRREDSKHITGRIYDYLEREYGDAVFKDVDDIPIGVDFRQYVDEQVSQCQIFLAVIGRGWLDAQDEDGQRRLDNLGDFVRLEIESALRRGIPVVPVLVDDARMPSAIKLPGSIQDLAFRNAVVVQEDPNFRRDMGRLLCGINAHFDMSELPSQTQTEQPLQRDLQPVKRPEPDKTHSVSTFEFEVPIIVHNMKMLFGRPNVATISVPLQISEYRREELGNGIVLDIVAISEGSFKMGAIANEVGAEDIERPQHQVILAPFWLGKYPVTQAQWQVVTTYPRVNIELKVAPSRFKGDNRPVECVSWHQAVEFCARLSQKTGRCYRLPSEAEWEYACRAHQKAPFHFGETITPELANYDNKYIYDAGVLNRMISSPAKGIYYKQTSPVGSFGGANPFGLYDMHGNVCEWCADYWHTSYRGAPSDGSVWFEGGDDNRRVCRGGSWDSHPSSCRSAHRHSMRPNCISSKIGFRVACTLP